MKWDWYAQRNPSHSGQTRNKNERMGANDFVNLKNPNSQKFLNALIFLDNMNQMLFFKK